MILVDPFYYFLLHFVPLSTSVSLFVASTVSSIVEKSHDDKARSMLGILRIYLFHNSPDT